MRLLRTVEVSDEWRLDAERTINSISEGLGNRQPTDLQNLGGLAVISARMHKNSTWGKMPTTYGLQVVDGVATIIKHSTFENLPYECYGGGWCSTVVIDPSKDAAFQTSDGVVSYPGNVMSRLKHFDAQLHKEGPADLREDAGALAIAQLLYAYGHGYGEDATAGVVAPILEAAAHTMGVATAPLTVEN